MAIPARLETPPSKVDRRDGSRRKLTLQAESHDHDRSSTVLVHNLSLTGMLLEVGESLELGTEIEVDLPQVGLTNAIVTRKDGSIVGCAFARPISRAAVSAAILRGPPLPRPTNLPGGLAGIESLDSASRSARRDYPPRTRFWLIAGSALSAWGLLFFPLAWAM